MVVERRRNVQLISSTASLAASGTVSCGIINCNNTRTATLSVKCTYGAATSGMTAKLYYSPDGTNYDTVPYHSFAINLTASATIQETNILDLPEHGYVEIKITNDSSSVAVTNISVYYTVARWGDQWIEADKIINKLEQIFKKQLELENRKLAAR